MDLVTSSSAHFGGEFGTQVSISLSSQPKCHCESDNFAWICLFSRMILNVFLFEACIVPESAELEHPNAEFSRSYDISKPLNDPLNILDFFLKDSANSWGFLHLKF